MSTHVFRRLNKIEAMYDWVARKRNCWAKLKIYVYAWPSYIASILFTRAKSTCMCTHVKIKRQWKSTLKCKHVCHWQIVDLTNIINLLTYLFILHLPKTPQTHVKQASLVKTEQHVLITMITSVTASRVTKGRTANKVSNQHCFFHLWK